MTEVAKSGQSARFPDRIRCGTAMPDQNRQINIIESIKRFYGELSTVSTEFSTQADLLELPDLTEKFGISFRRVENILCR